VQSNKYTIVFATIVCMILSVMLSVTYMSLKDRQELNRKIDRQKNILISAGIKVNSVDEVSEVYSKRVRPFVINRKGEVETNKLVDDLDPKKDTHLLPIYKILNNDVVESYVYPAQGVGLWSTLYGYIAVKPNGSTVVGITFYKEGETPGLGAEINKLWFRDNFIGKELNKNDKVVGVRVVKGKAKDQSDYKRDSLHMVDGISGATITGNGVTKMMKDYPVKYAPFFKKNA
jgi:Na+-transporting NADH:ubiquinone oxidoreductase subunit C